MENFGRLLRAVGLKPLGRGNEPINRQPKQTAMDKRIGVDAHLRARGTVSLGQGNDAIRRPNDECPNRGLAGEPMARATV